MRVLLDENTPIKLALHFPAEVEAVTVAQQGWKGVKNGELLASAQRKFDIFATTDKGIPQQQNPEGLDLGVLLRARESATKIWPRSWTASGKF